MCPCPSRLVKVTLYGSQIKLYNIETAVPSVLKPDLIDVLVWGAPNWPLTGWVTLGSPEAAAQTPPWQIFGKQPLQLLAAPQESTFFS